MTASRDTTSAADTASGIAAALTGLGILTIALFPFAIPIALLTAAFAAPFLLLGVVAALPLVIVASVVLAGRRVGRWLTAGG
jgi:hypothetical protein